MLIYVATGLQKSPIESDEVLHKDAKNIQTLESEVIIKATFREVSIIFKET